MAEELSRERMESLRAVYLDMAEGWGPVFGDGLILMIDRAVALDAVLEFHADSVLRAAVWPNGRDFPDKEIKPGQCYYCGFEPFHFYLNKERDRLNGEGPIRDLHVHKDPSPSCVVCVVPQPCPTREFVDTFLRNRKVRT